MKKSWKLIDFSLEHFFTNCSFCTFPLVPLYGHKYVIERKFYSCKRELHELVCKGIPEILAFYFRKKQFSFHFHPERFNFFFLLCCCFAHMTSENVPRNAIQHSTQSTNMEIPQKRLCVCLWITLFAVVVHKHSPNPATKTRTAQTTIEQKKYNFKSIRIFLFVRQSFCVWEKFAVLPLCRVTNNWQKRTWLVIHRRCWPFNKRLWNVGWGKVSPRCNWALSVFSTYHAVSKLHSTVTDPSIYKLTLKNTSKFQLAASYSCGWEALRYYGTLSYCFENVLGIKCRM